MTETSPTTKPGTAPGGSGTEHLSIAELAELDVDNPALKRAIANVVQQEGVLSAFQSAVI